MIFKKFLKKINIVVEWHSPLTLPSHGGIQPGTRALTNNHNAAKTVSALKMKANKRKKELKKAARERNFFKQLCLLGRKRAQERVATTAFHEHYNCCRKQKAATSLQDSHRKLALCYRCPIWESCST